MNPIASALAMAQASALVRPEPEQIHPETKCSSSRRTAPGRLSRTATRSRLSFRLPLRLATAHRIVSSPLGFPAAVEVVKAGGGGAGCCHGRWSHPDTCFSYNLTVVKTSIMLAVECNCLNVELKWGQKNYNHTGQESKGLLGVQGCHRNASGEEMAAAVHKLPGPKVEKSQLSKQDVRLLLVMCTELVNLCAKLTGKIDPAAAAMLAYVRDDIVSESKVELQ
jgi:hypothetical protein